MSDFCNIRILFFFQTNPYLMKREPFEEFTGNDRYEGFCKDLLEKLSERFGFKFIINPVKDGRYGDDKTGDWNGMIGELLRRVCKIHFFLYPCITFPFLLNLFEG